MKNMTAVRAIASAAIACWIGYGVQAAEVTHEGDTYVIVNTTKSDSGYNSAGNFSFTGVSSFTITIPEKDGLVAGDTVALASIEFSKASDKTGTALGNENPPVRITIDGKTSDGDPNSTDNALVPGRRKVVYAYGEDSRPVLTVGKASTVRLPGSQTFRTVVNAQNSDADGVIGINNAEYQPLTRIVCERCEIAQATVTSSTRFEDISWSSGVSDYRVLFVENNPTITIGSPVEFTSFRIVGDCRISADDSFYEEGCSLKKLLSAEVFERTGTVTAGELKEGYHAGLLIANDGISLRTQTKEVISINLTGGNGGGSGAASPSENIVSGSDYYGLAPVPGTAWNNINRMWQNGGKQTVSLESAVAYDGEQTTTRTSMKLSASANNTWQDGSIENPFLRGYLDDGGGVTVNVTGIPYETYDVIIYATSDSNLQLAPITVNGVRYTFLNGVTCEDTGTTPWGVGRQPTPVFGRNALMVRNQNIQNLTISSTRMPNGGPRATLCAVQVINMGEAVIDATVYTKTVATTETSGELTTIAYDQGTLVSSEFNDVALTLAGTAEDEPYALSLDRADTRLGLVKIIGSRPLALTTVAGLSGIPKIDLSEYTGTLTTLSLDAAAEMTLLGAVTCSGDILLKTTDELSVPGTITCPKTVTKDGSGTIVFGGSNTFTNLVVAGGLARTTNQTGFGANNYLSGDLAKIEVRAGATLNLASTADASYSITIAGDGIDGNGALINTGNDIGSATRQTKEIILSDDASVSGPRTYGLLAHGYGDARLFLDDHTLTKKGEGTFLLCNTTVEGTGRIVIEGGVIQTVNRQVLAENATIEVGASGTLRTDSNLTVKNLELAATATLTGSSTPTVTGRLAYLGEETEYAYAPVTLGPDAMVSLPEGARVRVTLAALEKTTLPAAYAEVPLRVVFNGTDYALAQIVRTTGGVEIRPALQRVNEVNGAELLFGYVFRGTTDGDWTNVANWYSDGQTDWTAYPTDRNSPQRRQRDDASKAESFYDPVLIDGSLIADEANRTVTVGQLEGWNPRIGVVGGAKVTIEGTGKWQTGNDGGKWLYIAGAGSQLRMTAGNPDVPVYCASEDGLFYDRTVDGGSVQYYLAGEGSVKYLGLTGGTHTFKRFDFTIGDPTKPRGIVSKRLVSVPQGDVPFTKAEDCVVTITDAAEHGNVTPTYAAVLAGDEALGTYAIARKSDGVYVKYIGYGDDVESILPKLRATGTADWSNAELWNVSAAPSSGEAVIEASGTLTVNVSDAVAMSTLTISGAAGSSVTIVGSGFTAAKVNVAEGLTYNVLVDGQYGTLEGEGTVCFDPGAQGTLMAAGDNTFRGTTVIRSGTVRMTHPNNFGAPNKEESRLVVKTGAVLDANGVQSDLDYSSVRIGVTLEEGSLLTNTGADIAATKSPVTRITLAGDATIDVPDGKVFSLGREFHWGATLNLGTNTLTKTGAGELCLGYCGATGSGRFDVTEGLLTLYPQYYHDEGLNALEATVSIAQGAVVELREYNGKNALLAAKNLVVDGEIRRNESTGTVAVSGSLSGSGLVSAPLTLGADAVLAVDGNGPLTIGSTLAIPEGDVLPLAIDGGLDLTRIWMIPVLKAVNPEDLPALGTFTEIPAKWEITSSFDGKTVRIRRPRFVITVR